MGQQEHRVPLGVGAWLNPYPHYYAPGQGPALLSAVPPNAAAGPDNQRCSARVTGWTRCGGVRMRVRGVGQRGLYEGLGWAMQRTVWRGVGSRRTTAPPPQGPQPSKVVPFQQLSNAKC